MFRNTSTHRVYRLFFPLALAVGILFLFLGGMQGDLPQVLLSMGILAGLFLLAWLDSHRWRYAALTTYQAPRQRHTAPRFIRRGSGGGFSARKTCDCAYRLTCVIIVLSMLLSTLPAAEPVRAAAMENPSGRVPAQDEVTLTSDTTLGRGQNLVSGPPGVNVDTFGGGLILTRRDITIPAGGGLLLKAEMIYRGWGGWALNYADYMSFNQAENGDVSVGGMWQSMRFLDNGDGSYTPPPGLNDSLVQYVEGRFRLTTSDGLVYTFDDPTHQQITRVEHPNGATLDFIYDPLGNLQQISDRYGRTLDLIYTGGWLSAINGPEGLTVLYEYNLDGNLVRVTDPAQSITGYDYDDEMNVERITYPRGNTARITYDQGRVASVTTDLSLLTFSYQPQEGRTTVVETVGDQARINVYTHDDAGRLRSLQDADGGTSTWERDERGNVARFTDAAGRVTQYTHNAQGDPLTQTDPLSSTITYSYDTLYNKLAGYTDPNGGTYTYVYTRGLVSQITNPLSQTTILGYEGCCNLTSITDPLSFTRDIDNDLFGNLQVITSPLGHVTTYDYDQANRLLSVTDANNNTVTFTRDGLGRPLSLTDALGNTILNSFDANGNQTAMTDPLGNTTFLAYDALDQLITVADPLGGTTNYDYDAASNLVSVKDEKDQETTFTYDALNRLTSERDPLGNITRYDYDQVGNLITTTHGNGEVTVFTYDDGDRMTAVSFQNGSEEEFGYDARGNLVAMSGGLVDASHRYDDANQLISTTVVYTGLLLETVLYGYNALGLLTTVEDSHGNQTTYGHDADRRLSTIERTGDITFTYQITSDPGNRPIEISPAAGSPGVRTQMAYDAIDDLVSLSQSKDATAFINMDYRRDGMANVTTITSTGHVSFTGLLGVIAYEYDALHRLNKVTFPDGSWEQYSYDAVGNRVQLTRSDGTVIDYTYNLANQLTAEQNGVQLTSYTYDLNGNLETRTVDGDTTTYTWSTENRLMRIDYPDSTFSSYDYAPLGNRISRTDPTGEKVYYVYDGYNLVLELDEGGAVVASYAYAELDRPVSLTRDGQTYYYLYDHLGSVIGLSDGGGNLVATYVYDPWGNLIGGEDGNVLNPFRFTGREWDAESGLYYYRARYYDPTLGRFLSRDPENFEQGNNHYLYVGGNPVNGVDPQGESFITKAIKGAGRFIKKLIFNKKNLRRGTKEIGKQTAGRMRDEGGTKMPGSDAGTPIAEYLAGHGWDPWAATAVGFTVDYYNPLDDVQFFLYDPMDWFFDTFNPPPPPPGRSEWWKYRHGIYIPLPGRPGPPGWIRTGRGYRPPDFTPPKLSYRLSFTCQSRNQNSPNYSCTPPACDGYIYTFEVHVTAVENDHGYSYLANVKSYQSTITPYSHNPGISYHTWVAGYGLTRQHVQVTVMATNSDGYSRRVTWTFPPAQSFQDPCNGGDPPAMPGNDHPDDNHSAASLRTSQDPDDVPAVPRRGPVALLNRGFYYSTQGYLANLGIASVLVDTNLPPEMMARLSTLVIPTGGLYGLEDSDLFRARLEQYVAQGNTVVVFAQQHGYEFSVLPAPPEDDVGSVEVSGYGWNEDQSCFYSSLYISAWHQLLSGFNLSSLTSNVDGYFTSYPSGTLELLSRSKNGQPGLVMYPFGQGWVVATSIYDDWGLSAYQNVPDSSTLARNLLAWSSPPPHDEIERTDGLLPEFRPGEVVSMTLDLSNNSNVEALRARLTILNPYLDVFDRQLVDVIIPPGEQVSHTLQLPGLPYYLGIWWVDVELFGLNGGYVQAQRPAARFVVSDPAPEVGPDKEIYLNITAPAGKWVPGSIADFTFHIYNYSDQSRDLEVRYYLPHHERESGNSALYSDQVEAVTVPAAVGDNPGYGEFTHSKPMFTTDRLYATMYEGNNAVDSATFGVWRMPPSVDVSTQVSSTLESYGESVVVTTTLKNRLDAAYDVDSTLNVFDPEDNLVYETSFTNTLLNLGTSLVRTDFNLPLTLNGGFYRILVRTTKGRAIGEAVSHVEMPPFDLHISPIEPPTYIPNSDNTVSFTVDNISEVDVVSGTFTVTLRDPGSLEIWGVQQAFTLPQGMTTTLDFPVHFSNRYGTYNLTYAASYGGAVFANDLDIPFINLVELISDQTSYRAGETLGIEVRVTNSGRFQENVDVILTVPDAGYSQTHATFITTSQTITESFFVPLPITLTAGGYPLTVTLLEASGAQEQWGTTFFVPPSELQFFSQEAVTSGDVFTFTVTNVGGEATSFAYEMMLRNSVAVYEDAGVVGNIWANERLPITFTMPSGALTGLYYLNGSVTDLTTGQDILVRKRVDVNGVSALLETYSKQKLYLTTEAITAMATITNTGTPISAANLSLRVEKPQVGGWRMVTYKAGDNSILHNTIRGLAIDGQGSKWFATYNGISVLAQDGTPFDKTDDRYQSFTRADGMVHDSTYAIMIDDMDLKWIGTWGGVGLLDDGGTLFDKSDDYWIAFTTEDGLVDKWVLHIADDTSGNMWFGTNGGGVSVLDYGGTPFDETDDQWMSFTTADGLAHGEVHASVEDSAGLMWFGTKEGVSLLDDNGTPFDKGDDTWSTFTITDGLAGDDILSVYVDEMGYKWFGTYGGGVSILDDNGTPFEQNDDTWETFTKDDGLSDNQVYVIYDQGPGKKWFGTSWSSGVSVLDDNGTPFNKTDDTWASFSNFDGLANNDVRGITIDASDGVWLGTYFGGVSLLDYNGTPFSKLDDTWGTFSTGDGLARNNVQAILIEDTGLRWLGTPGSGVSLLDDGGTPLYKDDDTWGGFNWDDGLVDNHVHAIVPDDAGLHWFGNAEGGFGGMSVLDDNDTPFDNTDDTWGTFQVVDGLADNNVYALTIDDTDLKWAATNNGASVLDDNGTPFNKGDDSWVTFTSADGLVDDHLRALVWDDSGLVWFGTQGGVSVLDANGTITNTLDDTWGAFTTTDGLASNFLYDITIDELGRKWFGTSAGLSILDDNGTPFTKGDDTWQSFTTADGLAHNAVYAVEEGGAGVWWLGTLGGVSVMDNNETPFDKADDSWQVFSLGDGLASEGVHTIVVDGSGFKWIGTMGGLNVLDDGGMPLDKSGGIWQTFTITDGLASEAIFAIGVDEAGRKWMGTSGGGVSVLDDNGTPEDKMDDTWGTFTDVDGLYGNVQRALTIDEEGNKWFGSFSGVSVLNDSSTPFDKGDDTWMFFSTVDGLAHSRVNAITEETQGHIWFGTYDGMSVLDDNGTPFVKGDDTWATFKEVDGLADNEVRDITVDSAGIKWIATWGGGVSILDDNDTPFNKADDNWLTFGEADGLTHNSIWKIVIDESGRKWIGITGGGVNVLDDRGTPFDKSDDRWLPFTEDEGLADDLVYDIAIDEAGRKWIGTGAGVSVLDDGGTLFDRSDDHWMNLTALDGLSHAHVRAIAIDIADHRWFGTESGGLNVNADQPLLLWEGNFPIELSAGSTRKAFSATQVITQVGALTETGKLYLRGALTSTTDQIVARHVYAFYMFPTQTGLTLKTDSEVYRPGQVFTITGEVRNRAPTLLSDQVLTVTQDGLIIHTEGPFDVPALGSYAFSVVTAAPGSTGLTYFEAQVEGVIVQDSVRVALPKVDVELHAPILVGSETFSLTLTFENTGPLDAWVEGSVSSSPVFGLRSRQALTGASTIPAGDSGLLQFQAKVTEDTNFTITLSGDEDETLYHAVVFGEAAQVLFSPQGAYCPGLLEIPYTLTNTGQLDVEFASSITVSTSQFPIHNSQLTTYLPLSGTQAGALPLELPAAIYTLTWQYPFGTGLVDFDVVEADKASMFAFTAGTAVDERAPLTVTVTNEGCDLFNGTLRVEGCLWRETNGGSEEINCQAFSSDGQAVGVELGSSDVYTLALGTSGLVPGVYSATISLLNGSGDVLGTAVATGTIPAPDLHFTTVPTGITMPVSQTVNLTFTVENRGGTGDQATVHVAFGDLEDEQQVSWLGVGDTEVFTYTFYLPDDLESKAYLVSYEVTGTLDTEGETGDLTVEVEGIDLAVDASSDKTTYTAGEVAQVTITITNQAAFPTPDLYALVNLEGITQTQVFSLTNGESISITFPVIVSFPGEGDTNLSYGVYHMGSDRSIYLNTLYLHQHHPSETLYTSEDVYQPGETVTATVVTTASGQLTVFAPGVGYSETLTLSGFDITFSFTLPHPMAQGTYNVYYTLVGCGGCAGEGERRAYNFNVAGPVIRLTDVQFQSIPGDNGVAVFATLTIASNEDLDVALHSWVSYPDGSRGVTDTETISLMNILNNHAVITRVITDTQLGTHWLAYALYDAGDDGLLYASGGKAFDLGQAAILYVETDKREYPTDVEPVETHLQLYADQTISVEIQLSLDDGTQHSEELVLDAGLQGITLTLPGGFTPGRRDLTATLVVSENQSHANTTFVYGTSLPDLRAGALSISPQGVFSRTVMASVSNEGGSASPETTARFYAGGALIGTAVVPPLEAGEYTAVSVVWSIQGKGGEHMLSVDITPVNEFNQGNNTAEAAVTLPRLGTGLLVTPDSLFPGEEVALKVRLTNLDGAATLPVTTSVEVRSPQGDVVHQKNWWLILGAGETRWLTSIWQSEGDAELGVYAVSHEATDAYGEYDSQVGFFNLHPPPPLVPTPPSTVSISGSTYGLVNTTLTFTATVTPLTATLPITFLWQTTEQSPLTNTGELSDTVTFTWVTTGRQTINVTASNAGGTIVNTHVITIHVPMQTEFTIYLPVIMRNSLSGGGRQQGPLVWPQFRGLALMLLTTGLGAGLIARRKSFQKDRNSIFRSK